MELLGDHTLNSHLCILKKKMLKMKMAYKDTEKQNSKQCASTDQVLNYFLHALFGCFHTFFGSFDYDLFTLRTCAWKAHHHTSVFISEVPKDLATTGHKVTVVLWIHHHGVLDHIVLLIVKQILAVVEERAPPHLCPVVVVRLTKLLMSSSSSFWASCTASSVPITVISSWSLSSAVGKMILAPVLSRTLRMFPPPFPMRNLWYSGFACSSAVKFFVCCGKRILEDDEKKKKKCQKNKSSRMPQTFSSANASSCCLALATSSTGPRMVTLSFPEPSVGKWMCTPPHSSMMERTKRPFDPIKELCNFDGMETSISVMFAWTK